MVSQSRTHSCAELSWPRKRKPFFAGAGRMLDMTSTHIRSEKGLKRGPNGGLRPMAALEMKLFRCLVACLGHSRSKRGLRSSFGMRFQWTSVATSFWTELRCILSLKHLLLVSTSSLRAQNSFCRSSFLTSFLRTLAACGRNRRDLRRVRHLGAMLGKKTRLGEALGPRNVTLTGLKS